MNWKFWNKNITESELIKQVEKAIAGRSLSTELSKFANKVLQLRVAQLSDWKDSDPYQFRKAVIPPTDDYAIAKVYNLMPTDAEVEGFLIRKIANEKTHLQLLESDLEELQRQRLIIKLSGLDEETK